MDVADDRVSSDWGVSLATWGVAAFRAKEDRALVRQQVRPRRRSGPGFPAQDDPGGRPATGISTDQVRGLSCVRRPVASAMPLSAADRQHLGDRRCPRPSTRCSRTLL